MKHNMKLTKKTILIPLLLVGLIFATSCIKEDLDECAGLTVKVVNHQGDDITALGNVKGTTLYVFDENLKMLEKLSLDKDFVVNRKEVKLNYAEGQKLHLVAWGNLSTANENIIESTTAADLQVMLKSDNGLATSPDSLFYGAKDVQIIGTGVAGKQEIVLEPKTGTITMATEGLQNYLNKNPKSLRASEELDFYLNKTLSGYNYKGEQIGDSVYYNPESQWDEASVERVTVEPKNSALGTNLSCAIQLGDQEIQSVTKALNSNDEEVDITVNPHQNTHVTFRWDDDGAFIGARITVTPWGEVTDNPDLKPKN